MTLTLSRLRVNDVVAFDGQRRRVANVNDCRAILVPLEKRKREFVAQTGPNAGSVVQFEEDGVPIGVSPNSEIPILGHWDPVTKQVKEVG